MKTQIKISILLATFGLLGTLQSCVSPNQINTQYQGTNTSVENTKEVTEISGFKSTVDPLAKFDKAKSKQFTDTAKIIAGIRVDEQSQLANIQKNQAWINHRTFLESSWSKLESQQLSKVRKWSDRHLKSINQSSPSVYYPFSGPDFLYAYSMFPKGKDYVLVGLEPVGNIPNFSKLSTAQTLQKLQEVNNALYAVLKFSFFRTNAMKVDMANQGVLPILFLFMARTNNTILDVQYIGIDKNSMIQKFQKGMVPGVKISFLPRGESTPRNLYYFSTDLSDAGLAKTPQFTQFVKGFNQPVTYLKAASYLMHYSTFSTMRNLVLSKSNYLLQDDSGIPIKYFKPDQWKLSFFGNYIHPGAPFNQQEYQPDLMNIYRNNNNIEKIDFGIGYSFKLNESNMMLATKKQKR